MKDLVTIINNQPLTTTLAIAQGVGRSHRGVIQLTRQYLDDLEEFGGVAFEMRPFPTPGGTQFKEFARLNERQATLLLSYMRNTEVIRTFKKELVRAFFGMAEALHNKENIQPAAGNFPDRDRPVAVKHWAGIAYVNHASLMLHIGALHCRDAEGRKARELLFAALRSSREFRKHLTSEQQQAEKLKLELLKERPLWDDIRYCIMIGLKTKHIARICKCHPSTIRRHVRKMEECGILDPAIERSVLMEMAGPLQIEEVDS